MRSSEIYQSVTDRIASMLEAGAADPDAWRAPWRAMGIGHRSAVGRTYRGVNTLLLADAAARAAYAAPVWATYRQWEGLGAQVRRGERGTSVVLWKAYTRKDRETEETTNGLFATSFSVFNAAQVENAEVAPAFETYRAPRNLEERDDAADSWIDSIGAAISYGGDRAYYTPAADRIALPAFETFDNATAFYGTAAHELTHWTAHSSRLGRDLSGRFGTAAYAAEELVAELGAAFSMARLGLESEPRADHAHYIANWARLLRSDNRAIFTAASKAQAAADYLFHDTAKGSDNE